MEKFVEIDARGESATRVAYALAPDRLPVPDEGSQWRLVENFNAGDEILEDARLKNVFKATTRDAFAIVRLTN